MSRAAKAGRSVARSRRAGSSRDASPRRRLLITAGPTREYFDAVRFISNPSSGKMGYALAAAAVEAGHDVCLVSGPVTLDPPKGVRIIRVTSAGQMAAASKKAFAQCDAAIFTAAVCDYRPKRRAKQKLAKADHPKSVELVNTEDIAASLGRVKGGRVTMAFAMETHSGRKHAESKLIRKKCDAIVLNGPENVGQDRATVELLIRGGAWRRFPNGGKRTIARRLIRVLERMMFVQESDPDAPLRRR